MKQEIILKEMKNNDLINGKHQKLCKALYYYGHFLVFI